MKYQVLSQHSPRQVLQSLDQDLTKGELELGTLIFALLDVAFRYRQELSQEELAEVF